MKAQIIQIGNSQGIRIPKTLLEDSGVSGEVELEAHPDGILIRHVRKPRGDWDARFKALVEIDEDDPLDSTVATDFEKRSGNGKQV